MATIAEALAVLEQRKKTPLAGLLEGFAGGIQQAQQQALPRAVQMMQMEQMRQQQIERQENQRQLSQILGIKSEQKISNDKKTLGTQASPPAPAMRLNRVIVDEKGKRAEFKVVEPESETEEFTPKNYFDPVMKRERIGKWNKKRGMVTSPEDLLADAPPKPPKLGTNLTQAQKSADMRFGREYAEYMAGGGYADTINQIQSLSGVLKQLELGEENLTGPVISAQPEFARKRINPESWAAQQAVEQSVQRTLKKTLGGQFTEREGKLFMERGYDPALPESENIKKLRRMIGQLKAMALAKQKAIDYFEENGSLQGFKGTLYGLKGGEVVEVTKDDFYEMMEGEPSTQNQSQEETPEQRKARLIQELQEAK